MLVVLHSTTIVASVLAAGGIRDQWALIVYDLFNLFMDILMIIATIQSYIDWALVGVHVALAWFVT